MIVIYYFCHIIIIVLCTNLLDQMTLCVCISHMYKYLYVFVSVNYLYIFLSVKPNQTLILFSALQYSGPSRTAKVGADTYIKKVHCHKVDCSQWPGLPLVPCFIGFIGSEQWSAPSQGCFLLSFPQTIAQRKVQQNYLGVGVVASFLHLLTVQSKLGIRTGSIYCAYSSCVSTNHSQCWRSFHSYQTKSV